ncbi:unnamed protein product, partial [Linum tenue]
MTLILHAGRKRRWWRALPEPCDARSGIPTGSLANPPLIEEHYSLRFQNRNSLLYTLFSCYSTLPFCFFSF